MTTPQAGPVVGQLNLIVQQGASWHVRLTYKVGADTQTATPVDLTDYEAHVQVRGTWYSDAILLSLSSVDDAGIVLGGASGTIDLQLEAETTEALDWRDGVYDLELIAGDGHVVRLVEGRFRVIPEVTR